MRYITHALSILLFASATFTPIEPAARAQTIMPLQVIVGGAGGPADISLALLRRAFIGEVAEYGDGKRLIPFNLPPGAPERVRFDRVVLGIEPADIGRFWIDRRIRGEGLPPRTLPSADLGMRVVASLPGAIAYVSSAVIDPRVRVLKVNGKAPGEPGYAFAAR